MKRMAVIIGLDVLEEVAVDTVLPAFPVRAGCGRQSACSTAPSRAARGTTILVTYK
jgi:hypothetical protein